jgi:hypothetical protein
VHGSTKCQIKSSPSEPKDCDCETCNFKWKTKEIKDPKGTNYRLQQTDCNKKNVIYIICCQKCNILYVGKTSTILRTRIQNHLSSIRTNKNTSIARHFNSTLHNYRTDFKFAAIDSTINSNDLSIREGIWMNTLETVQNGNKFKRRSILH